MITLSSAALVFGLLECIGQVSIGSVSDMISGCLLILSSIENLCQFA